MDTCNVCTHIIHGPVAGIGVIEGFPHFQGPLLLTWLLPKPENG